MTLCGVGNLVTFEGEKGDGGGDPAVFTYEDGDAAGLQHFQGWLRAKPGPLATIAEEVFLALPPPAITPGRKHRADAMERRRLCVSCIIANLAALALDPLRRQALAVPLQKGRRSRYQRQEFSSETLADCVRALKLLGVVSVVPGIYRRTLTTLSMSHTFRRQMEARGVSTAGIEKAPSAETILLRQRRTKQGRTGELVDYRDDAVSLRLRAEVERINAAINDGDLRIDGKPVPPVHMVRIFQEDRPRAAPSWRFHGRLYRGPWLDMPKGERRRLSLGGEPLADLDFTACFLHLAYARVGAEFPYGDPYAIPGLENHRPHVKRLFTSLFFRTQNASRLPKGFKNALPDGWGMARFLEAAEDKHGPIASLFGTEVGFEFFAMESGIMVAVLLRLLERGLVALPCHDGLMVGQTHKNEAAWIMREVSRSHLGKPLPVAEKLLW